MRNINEHQTDILNNLIEINNDRIEGYKTAIALLPATASTAIKYAFEQFRDQSIQFNNELIPIVHKEGEEPEEGTRDSGKLFRIWMDIKAMVSPSTILSILDSCIRGEEEHKKVYNNAIENRDYLEHPNLRIIESQSMLQTEAKNRITLLRDGLHE